MSNLKRCRVSRPNIAVTAICLSLTLGFITGLSTGCGKRRPPQPPAANALAAPLINGTQRGDRIYLFVSNPQTLRRFAPRRLEIYRLSESLEAPLPLTEAQFLDNSNIVASIDYDVSLDSSSQPSARPLFIDELGFGTSPVRLRYALRLINAENQRAAFSNFLLIEPAPRIARPPVLLAAQPNANGIALNWQAPTANVDDSTPINLLGYHVYRAAAPTRSADLSRPSDGDSPLAQIDDSFVRLTSTPVSGNGFLDSAVRFGTSYRYIVRAVSLGNEGRTVESLDSNAVSVTPQDVFPPAAPSAVSLAVAPGAVTLFYPANPEPDVIGYLVYRAENPDTPLAQWQQLTSQPIAGNTFRDTAVKSGTKYFYYLRAVDAAGNVSPPSEVVGELVP